MTAVKDFRVHQSGIRFASSCRRAAMFLEKPAGTLRSQETSPPLNRRHAVGKMLGPGRTGPDQAGLPVPSWPRSPSISIRCATRTMRCSVHGCDMLRVRQDCVRPASGPSAGGHLPVRRSVPAGALWDMSADAAACAFRCAAGLYGHPQYPGVCVTCSRLLTSWAPARRQAQQRHGQQRHGQAAVGRCSRASDLP